ncbi:MAG TPA: glycosyltransferase N-terminal domain-containing protein [Bdellovibrio sp.]
MSAVVFYFYKFIISPLAYLLLQILRPFLSGKLREMNDDRNSGFYHIKVIGSEASVAAASPFWIHAASGEIEYARPVIRELKRQYPGTPVLVTYSSPSAKKILAGLSDVDVWASLPWDMPGPMNKFVQKWNPRALLISRTDVWPVLLQTVVNKKIPAILFSATFADNSSRLRGVTRHLTKYTLERLTEIHCVSAEDIENLKTLALKTPVVASGDTRFDQVFHRLENPKVLKNELIPSPEDFVFIAGSTWPEDEAVIVPALGKLSAPPIKSIIAPHETTSEHLEALEKQIHSVGLKSVRYSQATQWPANTVLIIDQVGILAELYTWADVAFIGGSFKKQVHSVMEALAAGLPVMVGPYHRNNREALFYQKKNFSSGMVVQVIQTVNDVVILLQRMKKLQLQIPQIKEEIRLEVGKNRNSTVRLISAIEKNLQR